MSNPTWQNVLKSVLTSSELQASTTKPVEVVFPYQPWKYLEDRVTRIEAEIVDLKVAVEALQKDLKNAYQSKRKR